MALEMTNGATLNDALAKAAKKMARTDWPGATQTMLIASSTSGASCEG